MKGREERRVRDIRGYLEGTRGELGGKKRGEKEGRREKENGI